MNYLNLLSRMAAWIFAVGLPTDQTEEQEEHEILHLSHHKSSNVANAGAATSERSLLVAIF
jgi:hypothetical protein